MLVPILRGAQSADPYRAARQLLMPGGSPPPRSLAALSAGATAVTGRASMIQCLSPPMFPPRWRSRRQCPRRQAASIIHHPYRLGKRANPMVQGSWLFTDPVGGHVFYPTTKTVGFTPISINEGPDVRCRRHHGSRLRAPRPTHCRGATGPTRQPLVGCVMRMHIVCGRTKMILCTSYHAMERRCSAGIIEEAFDHDAYPFLA